MDWPFARYCFFTSRLYFYCTIIYSLQTPPLLSNILHNITTYCTPPPSFKVVLRSLEVFFFFFFFSKCFLGVGL